MSDLYTEELITRKTPAVEKVLRILMIAATILALAAGLFVTPLAFVVFLALAIVDFVKIPQFNLEFEYLYVNGEMDIDKIISKTKRKHVGSYAVNDMEIMAPLNSRVLDSFKHDGALHVKDCSSGEGDGRYAMVLNMDGKKEMIIFEPNETMISDIRRRSPRNVV